MIGMLQARVRASGCVHACTLALIDDPVPTAAKGTPRFVAGIRVHPACCTQDIPSYNRRHRSRAGRTGLKHCG